MKLRYDKEDDILMVWLANKKVDYAQQSKNLIMHFSKDNKPVLMEILEASEFLKQTSQVLPQKVRQSVWAV